MITAIRTICWIGACSIAVTGPVSAADDEHYAFVYVGGFYTNEGAVVLDDSSGGGAIGGGWGWRFHRLLTFELDANISSTDYEMRESKDGGFFDSAALTLSTVGMLGNVKLGPRWGAVRPHVGIGLGIGLIDVSLSAPGYWWAEPLESQFTPLTQLLGGFDFRIGKRSRLGIEYRDLAALRKITFDGEEIDGGGDSFVVTYRFSFSGGRKPPAEEVPPLRASLTEP